MDFERDFENKHFPDTLRFGLIYLKDNVESIKESAKIKDDNRKEL